MSYGLARLLVLASGIFVVIAGTASLAQQHNPDPDISTNRIPDRARAILEQADQIELLSLNSIQSGKVNFYGHEVLGKTTVSDARVRERLISAFENGVEKPDGPMICFNPRHGIHATRRGKTADFVICFECRQVKVYGVADETFLVNQAPQPIFDKILRGAGIKLAAK